MSLTSSLDDRSGPIARFFAMRFPNVRPMQKQFRERLVRRPTIRPALGEGVPWGTIGTAIDYRMRYYLAAYRPETTIAALGTGRFIGSPTSDGSSGSWPTTSRA